jgi:hypothetical protein
MHYTRGSSAGSRDAATKNNQVIVSDTKTLRPDPRPQQDSLQHFLLNKFRFLSIGVLNSKDNGRVQRLDLPIDQKITREYQSDPYVFPKRSNDPLKSTGVYHSDLGQLTERIDNPTVNSELNVDCISCHISKSEGVFARRELVRQPYIDHRAIAEGVQNQAPTPAERITNGDTYFWQVNKGYNSPRDLSNFTHKVYQAHPKQRFGEVYILNQFSHYFTLPMVSSRSVNESSESARFINQHFLAKPGPFREQCNTDGLKMCLLGADDELGLPYDRMHGTYPYTETELSGFAQCKAMMCGEKYENWSREREILNTQQNRPDLVQFIK